MFLTGAGSLPPQNVDRFLSFYQAGERAGRTFVCDHYQAAVLYQLNERTLSKPCRDGLRVYFPQQRREVERYEQHFRHAAIELDEILAAPDRYLMLARPTMILNDFAGRLPQGTRLLYGMWSGYLRKPEWEQAPRGARSGGRRATGMPCQRTRAWR